MDDKDKLDNLDDVDAADAPAGTISIGELIRRCNDAVGKMGVDNPHRYLLASCAYAMKQLVDRLYQKVH